MSHTSWAMSEFLILLGRHQVGLGVTWGISDREKNTCHITGFCRFGETKGNGALALQQICQVADRFSVMLTLTADNGDLVEKVYMPHGFVSDHKPFKKGWGGYEGMVSMKRMPMPRENVGWTSFPWESALQNAFSSAKERVRAEKKLDYA